MSSSCQPRKTEPDCFPGKSQQIGSFPTTKSNYLPPSAFLDPRGVEDADRGYANFMKDFKEPTFLTLYEGDDEAYRFVWIRSFDEPIILRIQNSMAKIKLTVKRGVGRGGYGNGGLIVDQSKDISILAWMKFKSLLEKECFWTLEINPKDTYVLNNYSYYLSLRNMDLDKAEAMSRKANELDPNNGNSQDTYAWILYASKKYTEAKEWIEKAILNGGEKNAVILEHYGDILFKLGDFSFQDVQKRQRNLFLFSCHQFHCCKSGY